MENKKVLISSFLDIGEAMLACGAEVNRVEDTLERISSAYGALRTDVFVITSNIMITVTFREDSIYTLSRRIKYSLGVDYDKLEKLNALSRRICSAPLSSSDLREEIKKINEAKNSSLKNIFGSVIASGAFAFFFGGKWYDVIVASLLGFACYFVTFFIGKITSNKVVQSFLSSLFAALLICLLGVFFPVLNLDKIAIGVIMLLIPGTFLTSAFRDLLIGDTISGILKMIQSFICALMISAGFMISIQITNVNAVHVAFTDGPLQLFGALLGSVGFALIYRLKGKYVLMSALGGIICWGLFLLCELVFGWGLFPCSLVAALFSELYSQVLARIFKTPSTIFLLPVVISLIPGSSLYYAAISLVSNNIAEFKEYGLATLLIIIGIALGIGISASIFNKLSLRKNSLNRTDK